MRTIAVLSALNFALASIAAINTAAFVFPGDGPEAFVNASRCLTTLLAGTTLLALSLSVCAGTVARRAGSSRRAALRLLWLAALANAANYSLAFAGGVVPC